ncbi:MAG: SDR family oxidoreductase [Halieaceae bacterium]|jgi:3-oxoacyl-[acyl-carrier protein] reductase|nr:SDR family oxidoreductase [Halieaceae bacterium]
MSQLAIITGASSGIGAAAAERFIAQGFTTINVSRRDCPVPGVENVCGDLAEPVAARAIASDLAHQIGHLNPKEITLVHNAALMLKDDTEHCSDEDLATVMQINIGAINTLNRALIPLMRQGSSVLYVGSTLSEKAVAGAFSYVVSKHAQLGMMRATCQDLMGRGIHTALICPGFTNTEMLRNHIGDDPDIMSAISNMNSFHRLIEPGEIAEMIVWSHANPVINGSVIHGNLGQQER